MQDAVIGRTGAAEVDRRWLPSLGAGWALKSHAELLGRVFKVAFLGLGTQFGSCHLVNTVTGVLGEQTHL